MSDIQPHADQVSPYPPEIIDAGAGILRALAERAASKGKVFEMLEYLELERQLLERSQHG